MSADPRPDPAIRVRAGVGLIGGVVRRGITRVFGPPPISADRCPGDPGLTGPDSASWRVIGEPAAIAGGIRGLLLQIAHPLAMAGVADHSSFREDALGRLRRTSAWVTITTFGSVDEAIDVTRRVRAIHRRVRGVAPGGAAYDAADPRLLAWVSIALTSSFLEAYRLWAPDPLGPDTADAFVAEQSRIAALLDPRVDLGPVPDFPREPWVRPSALPMIEEGQLPTTMAGLEARLADFGPELGLDPAGADAVEFLHRPPLSAGPLAAYRVLFAGVRASLAPEHRQVLGLQVAHESADLRRARILLAAMRRLTGTSPTVRVAHRRAASTGTFGPNPHGPLSSDAHASGRGVTTRSEDLRVDPPMRVNKQNR